MAPRRPRPQLPRGPSVERRLVAGSAEAISDSNFRAQFGTIDEAYGYIASAGLLEVPELWAIVTVPVRRRVGAEEVARWSPRRESLDDLDEATARRYRRSRVAQAEAAAHGVDLDTWYQVAPDVRAFRGHAPERARRVGESVEDWHDRLIVEDAIDFAVYIAREYEGMSKGRRGWLTRRTRAAARGRAA